MPRQVSSIQRAARPAVAGGVAGQDAGAAEAVEALRRWAGASPQDAARDIAEFGVTGQQHQDAAQMVPVAAFVPVRLGLEGGDVDRALTDAARTDTSRWGRLSVDNMREALWMMLLQEHALRVQITPEFYPLPNGLTPETIARGDTFDSSIYDAVSASTAQTALAWRWVPPAGPEITGEMIWPSSFDAAEDHATALLSIAELGLIRGCVPRRAPSVSVLGLPEMRVNPLDAPPDRSFYRKVERAYTQWQRAPICTRQSAPVR